MDLKSQNYYNATETDITLLTQVHFFMMPFWTPRKQNNKIVWILGFQRMHMKSNVQKWKLHEMMLLILNEHDYEFVFKLYKGFKWEVVREKQFC